MGNKREPVVNGGTDNALQRPSGDRVASVATWLWSRYTSVSTAGTSEEALYSDDLEANTLENDGDVMQLEYAGTYGNNSRTKVLSVYFANNLVFSTDEHADIFTALEGWSLNISIVRVSNTVIRTIGRFSSRNQAGWTTYKQISGLSGLATNEYAVEFRMTTPDNAGDATVTMCNALYIPVIT